ncbi:aminotransferase class I/II [Rathayibacter sp. AY1E4]|uniref:MalY/PatB family protein n=1 Tax=unclassified Rathayibacter TaxID=2609250 RepID=UPI000CE8180C|nr:MULTISPECIES: aminotransferase class I/II-fold pyridoxal phosphate-dependent enzyme [unclassified Rathayibacter]PPG58230.1 aminotransferase class I/II [Rathayibacter sp. AY1C5]PPH41045.1 aminotransferase class I/II [Rathayibacter sp. AY1E4]
MHLFDSLTRERLDRPTSRKWSLRPGTIGAWVAEMDFGTAPAVRRALHDAVAGDVLGYLSPSTAGELGEAAAEYLAEQYAWTVDPARVHSVSDVMAALGVAVTEFSRPGSPVIVPTPAYMPFLTYLSAIGREVIEVPGTIVDGRWEHDLDGIDAAFAQGAGTLVLCNPHNPTGSVLPRSELEGLAAVVERHGGRVFADEIHAPLRFDGVPHIPYASVSEEAARHSVTGTSASKAWNIPGLKAAQLITTNDADEDVYSRFGFAVQHGASNLGVIASTAAYREGGAWLDEVVDYLDGNRRLIADFLASELPRIGYRTPEATYLAWFDLGALGLADPAQHLQREAGVTLTSGRLCGAGYADHVRLVFAMPRPLLLETLEAVRAAV